jgi:hypothetical protein
VHHASKTSAVTPEHFYFIERGTGEVKHDTGEMPVGPGSLVFIPAGEWHQLLASDSGFDYVEFQAPFDFATTMDHDPLGKNWYIKGTTTARGSRSCGCKVEPRAQCYRLQAQGSGQTDCRGWRADAERGDWLR